MNPPQSSLSSINNPILVEHNNLLNENCDLKMRTLIFKIYIFCIKNIAINA